jgi:hypothetical protein
MHWPLYGVMTRLVSRASAEGKVGVAWMDSTMKRNKGAPEMRADIRPGQARRVRLKSRHCIPA